MADRPLRDPELVPALPLLALFDAGRVSPAALGMGVAVALVALRLVLMAGVGRLPDGDGVATETSMREIRIGLVSALCLGYALAAYGFEVLGLRARLASLRPLGPGATEALEATRAASGHVTRRQRSRLLAVGIAVSFLLPFAVDRDPGLYLEPGYWRIEIVLNWILLPFIGIAVAGLLGALWADARRLSALAERLDGVDLLDSAALSPFGRQALRMALLAVILPSLFAILISDQGFAEVVGGMAGLALLVGGTAFLLPVQGIHRRLRSEKDAELARIRAALRGDASALGRSGLAAWAGRATPADLLAYEARVAAVREWPFDLGTLARFATLLLLPLGSWLGGAVVERVLSRVLDR